MSLHGKQRATVCRYASTIVRRRPGKQKRTTEVAEQWLYCSTCHGTLFESKEKQGQCAVPFRDAANLASVRGVAVLPGVLGVEDVWVLATAHAARANP